MSLGVKKSSCALVNGAVPLKPVAKRELSLRLGLCVAGWLVRISAYRMGDIMQNNDLAVSMKLGMRRLASGVCVLSTRLPGNKRFAMTVSSVTSVSDSPASLLVCVNQSVSQQGYLATEGVEFAVNVLSASHQEVSNLCAGREPNRDRFEVGNWKDDDFGAPVLADAQAVFLCRTDQVTTYGTHKIIVGAIHKVIVNSAEVDPLLYADGCYGAFLRR